MLNSRFIHKNFKYLNNIRYSHSFNSTINKVNSHNEWDTLEEVIVGRVDNAITPEYHGS